ncbi:hypothetical protein OGAPHI_006501 [Ogataea philodendri]|uniref:Membrane protein TMS1 n=2 Tax=Saccharomycotina TaxID=147537 RepID=A0A9P8T0N9_9ASCO|nr:uncharacterized protein OGAPHI_006501 [Ogataea philodendri]KAH3661651.1 hypothetical protein OGAPHI_006501 [Ogataea philodendri]
MCSCCLNSQMNPLMGTFKSSVATRVTYAIIFLLVSILAWVGQSHSLTALVEKWTWGLFKYGNQYCKEHGCVGFTNVQRITLSLGVMHLVLAGLLIGVRSTANPRAAIQNGYWMLKLASFVVLTGLTYLVPDKFFLSWGNSFSILFSIWFILIGLILLVDFAHEWAETCMERIEEGEIYLDDSESDSGCMEGPAFWRSLLVGGTLGMYAGVVVLTVLMYIYFSRSGCGLNTFAITLNLLLTLAATALSVAPVVQEYNPNAGLAQSSMCCIYCTYLVFSACLSEPDDKQCNPLVRYASTRTFSVIVGAFFTFTAVAYTTTRAAGNSAFHHKSNANYASGLDPVSNIVSEQPSRKDMRIEALRQAVNEGSLPESALNDPSYFEDSEDDLGEEQTSIKYNYVLFHWIFFLATQYIASLLTVNVNVDQGPGTFVPVGRTYFNFGMKVTSSWMCYGLYIWTLLAPVFFPDRFL